MAKKSKQWWYALIREVFLVLLCILLAAGWFREYLISRPIHSAVYGITQQPLKSMPRTSITWGQLNGINYTVTAKSRAQEELDKQGVTVSNISGDEANADDAPEENSSDSTTDDPN